MKRKFFFIYQPFFRCLLTGSLLVGIALVIYWADVLVLPFLLALMLSYLLYPFIVRLDVLPSPGPVLVVYSVLLVLLGLVIFWLSVPLLQDLHKFAHEQCLGLELIFGAQWPCKWQSEAQAFLKSLPLSKPSPLAIDFGTIGAIHIWDLLAHPLLVLVLAFYFSLDHTKLLQAAKNMAPIKMQIHFRRYLEELDQLFSYAIRDQALLALLTSALIIPGLICFNLPYPFLLAVIGMLLSLVPFFGLHLFTLLVLGLAIQGEIWGILVWMLGVQIVQVTVLKPRVFNSPLHPLVTLLALMLGYNLAGFEGFLVATPVFTLFLALGRFIHQRLVEVVEMTSSPVILNIPQGELYHRLLQAVQMPTDLYMHAVPGPEEELLELPPLPLERPEENIVLYPTQSDSGLLDLRLPDAQETVLDATLASQETAQDWLLQERECALGLSKWNSAESQTQEFAELPDWLQKPQAAESSVPEAPPPALGLSLDPALPAILAHKLRFALSSEEAAPEQE